MNDRRAFQIFDTCAAIDKGIIFIYVRSSNKSAAEARAHGTGPHTLEKCRVYGDK